MSAPIPIDTAMGASVGFWKGCRPASIGCANCYAIMRQMPAYGYKHPTVVTVNKNFNKPSRLKKPSMIFVNPWSDFFIDDPTANANRDAAWAIMRNYSQHIFWFPTKHPENISRMLPPYWPLHNVWLGVSVENQEWANKRMSILREIPIHEKAIRWVCAEPILAPVRFEGPSSLDGYSWIFAGGESGNRKHPPRPNNPQWFVDMAAQCKAAGVPFLLAQLGNSSLGTAKCRCHSAYGCRAVPPGANGQTFEEFPPGWLLP